ncbi:transglutaminase domain-containing protein [Clostridium cellulovorans]|uniref:transglutaminase domain-containing protein n=1 Tax=Clostridium cellulovorans TaxID=1493 RepID=UPI001F6033F1|nr:transglutaminase-like domain-containing protein [Clostridium cellulovorans]
MNEAEANFCTSCGQKLNIVSIEQNKNYRTVRKKKKSKVEKILIAIISILIGVSVIYFTMSIREVIIETSKQVKESIESGVNKSQVDDGLKPIEGVEESQEPKEDKEMDYIVDNSMVPFNLELSAKKRWVWFSVAKDGKQKDYVLPVSNGRIDTKVYLPFNVGDYVVTVYTSTLEDASGTYFVHKKYNVRNNDARDLTFLLPDTYVESDSEEIIQLANSIVAGIQTDYEKTLAIHDWVSANIAYDTDAYFSNNIKEYSALETLRGRKAICNGYANLTAALNRAIGIRTKIVGGTATTENRSESHAWNETFVDGRWVIQDTTWDSGFVDYNNNKFVPGLTHDYFDANEQVFSQSHSKENEK